MLGGVLSFGWVDWRDDGGCIVCKGFQGNTCKDSLVLSAWSSAQFFTINIHLETKVGGWGAIAREEGVGSV